MDIWEKWQQAFELPTLFEEVRKEYVEYYDYVVANGQERINQILMIMYIVSITLSGLSMLMEYSNLKEMSWFEPFIVIMMIGCIISYPAYLCASYIKHKLERNKRV